ncbi:hypothetical protein C0993_009750 [Termitomyces sp. T159_Od127]|nr:hypothetical protein C0993_009750 [Termitomyces sp. T159_Od127]
MSTSSPEPPVDFPSRKERVKRPPNAWVLYRLAKSKEYRDAHPDQKFTLTEMSRIMSQHWAVEPEEEIRRFEQLAEEKLLEHRKLHPDYKYQPRRRDLGDEQKKPRKVKEGRVTKPRRTQQKGKVALTATDATTTGATDAGHWWPEANGSSPASGDVFDFGSVVPLIDIQRALANYSPGFVSLARVYTLSLSLTALSQVLDKFNTNPGAQPMAYSDQPYAHSSHVPVQPSATSQVNAYQLMTNGETILSSGQSHTGGSFQPFNADEANTSYDQVMQAHVAAETNSLYATPRGISDGLNRLNCLEQSMLNSVHGIGSSNGTGSLDATVTPFQDLSVFPDLADLMALNQYYLG